MTTIINSLSEAKQFAFDEVYKGLEAQGWRRSMSTTQYGVCAYRGEGDRKCAAGHLIPDELYNKQLEGRTVQYMIEFKDVLVEPLRVWLNAAPLEEYTEFLEFVLALQRNHDDVSEYGMRERFDYIRGIIDTRKWFL